MATNRWHVGESRDEPLRDRIVATIFSIYDTPAGSNVAGLTYSSLKASNGDFPTEVPAWVTLDATDLTNIGNGSLFGVVEQVALSPRSLTNAQRQAALNSRHTNREPTEQALLTEQLRFYGYVEAE